MAKNVKDLAPAQAGWRLEAWVQAIPCSRQSFYNFAARDPDLLKFVKLGSRTIVLISPADYLAAKLAQQAGAPRVKREARSPGRPRKAKKVARSEPAPETAPLAALSSE